MAKTETVKKKKNIVQRMMFGNENKPDLTPEHMKMSKWAMFKYLFFHRFGTMVALNLLTCLFAVPAVLIYVLFYLNISVSNGLIPYSANLGIGYPVTMDAVALGVTMTFNYKLLQYALMVPGIAVFALGVAGNLYVMRKLIWEQPTRTFKDFFIGIKKCWLGALLIGFAFGLTVLFLVFSLGYFDAYYHSTPLKALSITLSIILLIFMILFTSFFMTQNAAFKMRPMVLIRNSVLFIVGTHILSIIMIGVGIAPVFLALIPNITMIFALLYVFIGISFSTLVISLYCHYCYERFLYDKVDDAPSVYTKRVSDVSEEQPDGKQQEKKRQAAVPYKNPKKRKKSIDEGSSITPLTPMFRREDLERLQTEHEKVQSESEIDIDADLGELDDEDYSTDASDVTAAPEAENDIAETTKSEAEADNETDKPHTHDGGAKAGKANLSGKSDGASRKTGGKGKK